MPDDISFDVALQQAIYRLQQRETDALRLEMQQSTPHVFSDNYQSKMNKLTGSAEKVYFFFVNTLPKRVALIVAVTMVALTITTFSVEALRKPVLNFFEEVFSTFSRIVFFGAESEPLPDNVEGPREPTYIPVGYSVSERELFDAIYEITYTNGDDEPLLFSQLAVENMDFSVDTEGVTMEDVPELQGKFYSNKGWNNLIWSDGQYGYHITGKIDKETLIKMALSVK